MSLQYRGSRALQMQEDRAIEWLLGHGYKFSRTIVMQSGVNVQIWTRPGGEATLYSNA